MGHYYSGRVHSVVFTNPAQDFYILKMVLDDDPNASSKTANGVISVKGTVPGLALDIGSWFGFEAKWENHEKFGRQLTITKAPVLKDKWDPETACAMLTAHGVGERIAKSLLLHFDDNLIEVLDEDDPDSLREAPGMTPFAATHVLSRWKLVKAYFQTLEFLSDAGVPKSKISQVWSLFGDKAEEVLSTDPWALVRIDGIKFHQADEVALRLDLDMDGPHRVRGAALYSCKEGRGLGHMFLSSGDMVSKVQSLVPAVSPKQVAVALAELHKSKDIIVDRTTRPGTTAIYEPWSHQMESAGASLIYDRTQTADPFLASAPVPLTPQTLAEEITIGVPYPKALSSVGAGSAKAFDEDPEDLVALAKAALEDWSHGSKINLAPMQMAGALNALTAPVSILTGLPGTGKTTTLKAVVSVLKDAGIPFLLCAPTGIAAKRMSSLTGAPASTIHRAFGAKGWNTGKERESTYVGITGTGSLAESSDGSAEQWEYSPENPHPAQVLICDEFSMVDQHLLYRILTSTSQRCRLVFVGDAAQLPSVGAGNVLRNLLESKLFSTVSLTEIFRQADTSDIVVAAHAIHRGAIPECGSTSESDFILIESSDEDEIQGIVTKLATKLYTQRRNFQVLSPRHGGTLGVTTLNQKLRGRLNPMAPGLSEMRLGSEIIREDDRVMVVKNNYDLGIFNGDVGKVSRIDRKAREIEIKLHGPPVMHVRIPFKDAPHYLRLAYCMTVHKSQGQEYDVIVMPLVKSFGFQLQRNLFYTAITRAKVRVLLVGQREALVRAVNNNREDVRNTLFTERLLSTFQGGSVSENTA